jgi:hypothetical protein
LTNGYCGRTIKQYNSYDFNQVFMTSVSEIPDTKNPPKHKLPDEHHHKAVIAKARNALLITAGLVLLSELIGVYRNGGIHPIILLIVAGGVGKFIILALWAKRKPFNAVLAGLMTFISINIFAAVVYTFEEEIGFSGGLKILSDGLLLKTLTLLTLILALSNNKSLRHTQKALGTQQANRQ